MTVPIRRIIIGLVLSVVVIVLAITPSHPDLDTPATSPDIMTYDKNGDG